MRHTRTHTCDYLLYRRLCTRTSRPVWVGTLALDAPHRRPYQRLIAHLRSPVACPFWFTFFSPRTVKEKQGEKATSSLSVFSGLPLCLVPIRKKPTLTLTSERAGEYLLMLIR